jgi:hypothetical protein
MKARVLHLIGSNCIGGPANVAPETNRIDSPAAQKEKLLAVYKTVFAS